MARARLHIICGNCGCNDMFKFEIVPEGHDVTKDEPEFEPQVRIYCGNCSTLHDLSNTIDEVKTKKGTP